MKFPFWCTPEPSDNYLSRNSCDIDNYHFLFIMQTGLTLIAITALLVNRYLERSFPRMRP